MKVTPKKDPYKGKKNVKKDSPKKSQQPNTIISMFKKQQSLLSKGDNSCTFKERKDNEKGNSSCVAGHESSSKQPLNRNISDKGGNSEGKTSSGSDNEDVTITKVEQTSSYFTKDNSDTSDSCKNGVKKKKLSLSLKKSSTSIVNTSQTSDLSNSPSSSLTNEGVPSTSQKENSIQVDGETFQNVKRLSLRKRKSSANILSSSTCSKKKRTSGALDNSEHLDAKSCDSCEVEKEIVLKDDILDKHTEDFDEKLKSGLERCDTECVDDGDRTQSTSKNGNCEIFVEKSSSSKSESHSRHKGKQKFTSAEKCLKDIDLIDPDLVSESESKEIYKSDSEKCLNLKNVDIDDTIHTNLSLEDKTVDDGVDDDAYRVPYYLDNFRTVIKSVLDDTDNIRLFSSEDMKYITNFSQLSESAQKLYVRIFSRKWTWLPLSKLKYNEIDEDISLIADELAKSEYLLSSELGLTDLGRALNLLQAGELKNLAKTYHITKSSQNKGDIISKLIKKSKQNTIGTMFKAKGLVGSNMMLSRAKKLLGSCYMQNEEPRNVFIRLLMLFSLPNTVVEDDANGGQNQLLQMLMVNMGKIVYPTYKVNKKTTVFADRSSLIRFSEASIMEHDMLAYLERNDYNSAFDIYTDAAGKFESLLKNKGQKKFDESLPIFLRPYTTGSVYVRILTQGVEILQRRRNYPDAVKLLHQLLQQECYCPEYRGRWWDRLALNYDAHLKDQQQALNVIKGGLNDSYVKTGHRLSLYQRAEKICTASTSKFKSRMKDFYHDVVLELPQKTIEGTMLSDNVPGMKYKFMIKDPSCHGDADDVTFCGVEELVLQHYKQNGYSHGLHAEGSVVSNLFCLYFWDIIFKDVPDTFHSPFQTHPLDLYFGDFFANRMSDIDRRIETIHKSTEEELHSMITETWDKYNGTACVGMNWERFDSLQHVQGLVSCMKAPVLAGILERYGKDPKNTRGGFPDLTLWNTETKCLKISEVKGPGDRLSHKQILWISYLLKIGVDAEVCHVKGVGSKRLKPNTT